MMWTGNYYTMQLPGFWPLLAPLVILDLVLKGFALWRAARNNHLYWFVALLFINSAGILPAIYLIWDKRR